MHDLIARYVYDVTRRLPEKERQDVGEELKANIYDMLPENPGEQEIKEVLSTLGPPAVLAEQYRQKPRYLISPAMYDPYVRTLKWVLPLVGLVVMAIAAVVGVWQTMDAAGAATGASVDGGALVRAAISQGIGSGISAAFQAMVWVTVGFAIADRAGYQMDGTRTQDWTVDSLPAVPVSAKSRIPLSDSIVSLVMILLFSVLAILFCAGVLPLVFSLRSGGTTVYTLFSDSFKAAAIPIIAAIGALGIAEYIIKILFRRWTPFVCGATILSALASMAGTLYLLNRADMFSAEATAFFATRPWGDFDLLRFAGQSVANPVILVLSVIVVVCCVAECATAIYKTVRAMKPGDSQIVFAKR